MGTYGHCTYNVDLAHLALMPLGLAHPIWVTKTNYLLQRMCQATFFASMGVYQGHSPFWGRIKAQVWQYALRLCFRLPKDKDTQTIYAAPLVE